MSKSIIFDFDGTLVNSEKAIYQCFQSVTNFIAPERINFAKNILIGPPLRETASEILGLKYQVKLDEFVNLFIKLHDEEVILHTHPYPHVNKVLKKLNDKKILMGIATNKRKSPTLKLIKHYGWQDYFISIECSDSQKSTRNKDEMIQDIINNESGFNEAFFVGDTVNDGISSNLNQLKFIKASYGYGKNQDWSNININKTIMTFAELEQVFN